MDDGLLLESLDAPPEGLIQALGSQKAASVLLELVRRFGAKDWNGVARSLEECSSAAAINFSKNEEAMMKILAKPKKVEYWNDPSAVQALLLCNNLSVEEQVRWLIECADGNVIDEELEDCFQVLHTEDLSDSNVFGK
jgi:hypothetical protein